MTLPENRTDAFLDAIDNFKSLPKQKQKELSSLFDLTHERFKELRGYTELFDAFLEENGAGCLNLDA